MKKYEVGWAYSMDRSEGKCIQICDGQLESKSAWKMWE